MSSVYSNDVDDQEKLTENFEGGRVLLRILARCQLVVSAALETLPMVSLCIYFVQISCYASRDINDGDDDFEIVTHRARSVEHHRLCEIPASCLIDHLLYISFF